MRLGRAMAKVPWKRRGRSRYSGRSFAHLISSDPSAFVTQAKLESYIFQRNGSVRGRFASMSSTWRSDPIAGSRIIHAAMNSARPSNGITNAEGLAAPPLPHSAHPTDRHALQPA